MKIIKPLKNIYIFSLNLALASIKHKKANFGWLFKTKYNFNHHLWLRDSESIFLEITKCFSKLALQILRLSLGLACTGLYYLNWLGIQDKKWFWGQFLLTFSRHLEK